MALDDGIALWHENSASHHAHMYRQLLAALVGHRTGVLGISDLRVVQRGAGANMSVDVAFGDAVILHTDGSDTANGCYFVHNGGTVNLAIAAADATNARRDIIVIDVRDSEVSGVTDDVRLRVVQGTPSGSPADPTLPDNRIELAQVLVAAGATSIVTGAITDRRFTNQSSAQTGGLILPAGIPDQTFEDALSGGTATSATAYATHNSILVAPYDLTMIVDVMGEWGNPGSGGTSKTFRVLDEAGANITVGQTGGAITWNDGLSGQTIPLAARGIKDYSAGDTVGFRLAYLVTASNVDINSNARVSFVPKVNT